MFKTAARTVVALKATVMALCMVPSYLTPASAADIPSVRSGHINTLGAIRRANPNALNRAMSGRVFVAPPRRGSNVSPPPRSGSRVSPPPRRGNATAPNNGRNVRTPSGRGHLLIDSIRRLRSVTRAAAPRRTTGSRNRLADRIRRLRSAGRRTTGTRNARVQQRRTINTVTRKLVPNTASRVRVIDKVRRTPSLQDKIAKKIAARAVMATMARAKDDRKGNVTINPELADAIKDPAQATTEMITGAGDNGNQVEIVTTASQTFNPNVRTEGGDGPTIVTTASQTFNPNVRTEGGDGPTIVTTASQTFNANIRTDDSNNTQKSDGKAGNALPYDEFRERGAALPSAADRPVVTSVPGLSHAALDTIKENGMGFERYFPGAGRPGGAGPIELMPPWLGQAPGLTLPDGTQMSEPEGTPMAHPEGTPSNFNLTDGGNGDDRSAAATVLGGGASAIFQSRGNADVAATSGRSQNGRRVADDEEDVAAAGGYDFTKTEAEERSGESPEPNAYGNPDMVFYLDGSANSYQYNEYGQVSVASHDTNGNLVKVDYLPPQTGGSSDAISPRADDTGPTMPEDGNKSIGSVINREQTGQRNPAESTGGVAMINGIPVGRLLTSNNGRGCQVAKCNSIGDENTISSRPAIWNAFNVHSQVVNPVPQP